MTLRKRRKKRRKYELSDKQNLAWFDYLNNDSVLNILFDGGTRSGKTDITLIWFIAEAQKYDDARLLCARQTGTAARSTVWVSLKKLLKGTSVRTKEQSMEAHFPNGSIIRCAGLDTNESVDKILGDEYLHIFINEATQVLYDTYGTVITRLAQPIKNKAGEVLDIPHKIILDCNPKGPRHWIHKLCIQGKEPESGKKISDDTKYARLHWVPYDNPALSPAYIKQLEALPELKKKRMLEGIWADNEGAVYEIFDENVHVLSWKKFQKISNAKREGREGEKTGWRSWRLCAGIDFGFTNPFVYLFGAIDHDGNLYIYDEHYMSKKTVRAHAEEFILPKYEKHRVSPHDLEFRVADHDAEDRETLHENGLFTQAAWKSIIPGLDAVTSRLQVQENGRPRLFIVDNCVNLIQEFYDYMWPESVEGKNNRELPVDANNHALDALRYIVMHIDRGFIYSTMDDVDESIGDTRTEEEYLRDAVEDEELWDAAA